MVTVTIAERGLKVMVLLTALISFITLLVGATVSGGVTYLEAKRKLAFDYDADLRQRRIGSYADLWSRLEPLAKYAASPRFSNDDAQALSASLRHWYFEEGGLFLSAAARRAYFSLQDAVTHIIAGIGWESPSQERLTPAAREYLRTCGSRLRSSLIRDVGTRTRPRIKGDAEPLDYGVAGTYERQGDHKRIKVVFKPRISRVTTPRLLILEIDTATSSEKPVKICEWDPELLRIRVILDDPGGSPQERIILLEGGRLVEGPAPDDRAPTPPALWRPVTD